MILPPNRITKPREVEDPDEMLLAVDPPLWVQCLAIVWPMSVALFVSASFLLGHPGTVSYWPIGVLFGILPLLLLWSIVRCERDAYFAYGLYALIWVGHMYLLPRGGLFLQSADEFRLPLIAWHLAAAIAYGVGAFSYRSSVANEDKVRFSRRFLLISGAATLLIACGLLVSSFVPASLQGGRPATREDLIGDWWGVHDAGGPIRLMFRESGKGFLVFGSATKEEDDYNNLSWMMRGRRLHIARRFEGQFHDSYLPVIADNNSLSFGDRSVGGTTTFYRKGSPEWKRLQSQLLEYE